MIREEQTNQIKDLLQVAQSALVIVGQDASSDQLACASALALSLQNLEKQVLFLSPKVPAGEAVFHGLEQLQTQLGNEALTVGFPYNPDTVDKVSYHIDEANQRFYLVVKPQKGKVPLDASQVEFSYTGANTDLIFLVGVHAYETLEQLYFGYETLYTTVPVVTFHTFEPGIGSIKIDASGTSCLSESMASFLFAIGAPPDEAAASNLLAAIEEVTDSFKSFATTAETFDIVAYLLRQGARRQKRPVLNPARQLTEIKPTLGPVEKKEHKKTQPQPQPDKKSKSKVGDLHYQPSGFSPGATG